MFLRVLTDQLTLSFSVQFLGGAFMRVSVVPVLSGGNILTVCEMDAPVYR